MIEAPVVFVKTSLIDGLVAIGTFIPPVPCAGPADIVGADQLNKVPAGVKAGAS